MACYMDYVFKFYSLLKYCKWKSLLKSLPGNYSKSTIKYQINYSIWVSMLQVYSFTIINIYMYLLKRNRDTLE